MKKTHLFPLVLVYFLLGIMPQVLAQNALVINTNLPSADTLRFSQIRSIKYQPGLMLVNKTGGEELIYPTNRILECLFVQLCDTPTQVSISGPNTICTGSSTVFTASSGNANANTTYSWSGPGLTSSSASTGNISAAGTYTCIISNGLGCTASVSRQLTLLPTVNPFVSISASPGNAVCEGALVTFSIDSISNGGLNPAFQWRINGTNVLGETADHFSFQYAGTGNTVSLVMSSSENCPLVPSVNSNALQVTVNPSVFGLSVSANNTVLSPPWIVDFNNNTPNLQNYVFTWNFGDGLQYIGADPPPHQYLVQGTYSPSLSAIQTSTGCADSLFLQQYIQCNSGSSNFCNYTANISPGSLVQGCANGSVMLQAESTAPNPLYQWFLNGFPLGGATDDTLYATQPGVYQLSVFSSDGCLLNSAGTTVTLNLPAIPAPLISLSGALAVCDTVSQITCTVLGNYSNYQWSEGSTGPVMLTNQGGIYQVMVTDAQGCTALSDPMVLNASNVEAPQICLSTVDYINNAFVNTIIWEKPLSTVIDSFLVYKETVPGVFQKIGARAYEDSSIYQDYTTNPNLVSERYRLAVRENCGSISLPGYVHETMHLQVMPGTNNDKFLSWNPLLGINVDYYIIESGPTYNQLTPLDSVPSTQNTYLDTNPVFGLNAKYLVSVRLSSPCTPGKSMMQGRVRSTSNGGTNNSILQPDPSNFVPAHSQAKTDIRALAVPNPSDGRFRLLEDGQNLLPQGTLVQVWDVSGRKVYTGFVQEDGGLSLQHLQPGYYHLGYSVPGADPSIIRIGIVQHSR